MVKKIIFLFLFVFPAYGIEVTSSVSKNPVGLGESFFLKIRIISEESVNISDLKWPQDISPFVIENSSRSSRIFTSFSYPGGGTKEIQNDFQYQLSSEKEGKWTIGSIQVVVDGKFHSTKPVEVTVLSQKPKMQPPPSIPKFPHLFNIFEDQPFFQDSLSKENFILKVHTPQRPVYLGEMVFVDWSLYRKQGLSSAIVLEEVNLVQPENFWIEKIHESKFLQFDKIENIEEKPYLKALINSYVLFPLKKGVLKIHPLKIKIRSRGTFHLFSNQGQVVELNSKPAVVRVLPLPKKAKGEFTGAVGSFIIESKVNRKEILKNEILSYKIRFFGQGNVQMIQLPKWPEDSHFKVYDVLESQEFSVQNAWKEYEILLSPKKIGLLKTPLLLWTTFDPSLKGYVNHELPPVSVNVKVPEEEKEESLKFFEKHEKTTDNTKSISIEKFKPSFSFYKRHRVLFWVGIYILIISVIFFKNKNNILRRQKNWNKILKDTFQKAREEKNKKNFRQAGVLILNLMDQIWSEVDQNSGRRIEEILKKCPPSLRKDYGEKIQSMIKNLEKICFAPEKSEIDVEKVISQCEVLIPQILKYKVK